MSLLVHNTAFGFTKLLEICYLSICSCNTHVDVLRDKLKMRPVSLILHHSNASLISNYCIRVSYVMKNFAYCTEEVVVRRGPPSCFSREQSCSVKRRSFFRPSKGYMAPKTADNRLRKHRRQSTEKEERIVTATMYFSRSESDICSLLHLQKLFRYFRAFSVISHALFQIECHKNLCQTNSDIFVIAKMRQRHFFLTFY